MKKLVTLLLVAAMLVLTMLPMATAEAAFEFDGEGSILLKATGMVTFSFAEEQDEDWADAVEEIYVREMPEDPAAEVTEDELVDDMKYTVSTTKVILDSDIFDVAPSTEKTYEVVLCAEGYDNKCLSLTIQNKRPVDFTVRTIDGEGNVVTEKVFTYEEMEALCVEEAYSSAACPMHGLNNYHVIGVKLTDLFAAAGVEFTEGMSMANRVVDAPASIEATEVNTGAKTGYVLENPEKYWVKPRYTDNYKLTYEDLYGRERYFIHPWDDEAVAQMLAEDGSKWSIDARIALAESGLYDACEPMIAIQYESFEYNTDPRDCRTTTDVVWDLSRNERGFAFVYGLAMDDDPTVNTTAWDDETSSYPIVTDESYAGKTAIEEGPDACGNSARQAKLVFGIDIFLEGGVN